MLLVASKLRPQILLALYQQSSIIRYDFKIGMLWPNTKEEAEACPKLLAAVDLDDHVPMQITGISQKYGENRYSLEIREFKK